MFGNKRNEALMASIRNGLPMTQREKLNLIVGLSIPSILAQITNVMMFFIDASMVGHLGAEASASIGLVESTTWLLGSVMGASAMGFSVMVAHFIGANDFVKARQVLRHAFVCGLVFASALALMGVAVHASLPFWLGGKADIAPAASNYFLVISLCLPFMLLFHLSCDMLKSAGNMHVPSVMSVVLCVLDVVYNYFFIYLLGLGVMGAAIGTALAYVTVSLPATWITERKNKI